MDEQELVRSAQTGDERAFEELVRTYESRIYSVALRWTGNREDALDISQEVFLRVYRFLGSFDCRSSFSTWIYRVAVNVCKDTVSRRARQQEQPLEYKETSESDARVVELPDERYEPERVSEERMRSELLAKAITSLPDEQRVVILLRDVRGLSYQEIGEILTLEEGTVKSRIFRAREKLRATLAASGNFFTSFQSKQAKGGRNE